MCHGLSYSATQEEKHKAYRIVIMLKEINACETWEAGEQASRRACRAPNEALGANARHHPSSVGTREVAPITMTSINNTGSQVSLCSTATQAVAHRLNHRLEQ